MPTRRKGQAPPARDYTPGTAPPQPDPPQPAPGHGTPVDANTLARLKRRARSVPPKPGGPAQNEDPDH